MDHDELKELLEENEDFRSYVEKLCKAKNITVEQALHLKQIEIVARYYIGKGW